MEPNKQIWLVSFCILLHLSASFLSNTKPCQRSCRNNMILHGVLSRSAIINNAGKNKEKRRNKSLDKYFLLDVLEEASYRQKMALESLDREIERRRETAEPLTQECDEKISRQTNSLQAESSTEGDQSANFNRINERRDEINNLLSKLKSLETKVLEIKSSEDGLQQIKKDIVDLGFESIFRQPMNSWKTKQAKKSEFGRPQGFEGLVFYSPLGAPILVGRMKAHKDDVMRNAAQGCDLWFQVEDYNGSRVLLRTSLARGTKGSKQCIQMAANLAARYSIWGKDHDSVPVMYTDSRKVAKRGSKVGQMRQRKSLGRLFGNPFSVEKLTKGKEL